MFGKAIAEFEFTLTFADAPIDRFARGERDALTEDEKKGALLFFGAGGLFVLSQRGRTVERDVQRFRGARDGVPQIAPRVTNSTFDGRAGMRILARSR